jgi:hypothetical protein
MSVSNPFNFTSWLSHDGDGGDDISEDVTLGQFNHMTPDLGSQATIIEVTAGQNAALVGQNSSQGDGVVGVFGESDGKTRGIGVAGACDAGCGVCGVAASEAVTSFPSAVGVLGVGDFHGVYGVSGTVASQAPDLSTFAHPAETVAVVGANGDSTTAHAPAILGLNDILAGDITHPNFRAATDDLIQQPSGIAGVSKNGDGVIGISFDLNRPVTDIPINPHLKHQLSDPILDPIDGTPEPIGAVGVAGLAMTAPGIRGISEFDRGGVFQSSTGTDFFGRPAAPIAQIRLVPLRIQTQGNPQKDLNSPMPDPSPPSLPRAGQVGDILAVASVNSDHVARCELWFCVRTHGPSGSAVWAQIALFDRGDQLIQGTL